MSEIDNPNVLTLELISNAMALDKHHSEISARITSAQVEIERIEKRKNELREALVKLLYPENEDISDQWFM
jgi:hypothetical protein